MRTLATAGLALFALLATSVEGQPNIPKNPRYGWKDSYSVNGKCYCDTTFDHNIGGYLVDTPAGKKTVREVCNALGKGPGAKGNPVYNDVQCGHGPANNAGDEDYCPGRVDQGKAGCWKKGPKWDLSVFEDKTTPPPPSDNNNRPNIPKNPSYGWKDSYSVNGKCYCDTTFDHNIGGYLVDTPAGKKTVKEVCTALGKGPGAKGNPVYNDVQCGHGPANDAGDEDYCPGRVDQGKAGCWVKGPKWDLSVFEKDDSNNGPSDNSEFPVDAIISLRKTGGNRYYVTAEKFGSNELTARAPRAQGWEKFRVEVHPRGGIALRALSNNKYVQVSGNKQNTALRARGEWKGTWEQFKVQNVGNGRIALQSVHTGKWITVSNSDNNAKAYPRGGKVGNNEILEWERH